MHLAQDNDVVYTLTPDRSDQPLRTHLFKAATVLLYRTKKWCGFNPATEIRAIEDDKVRRGRKAWQAFRELTVPKWSEGFIKAVRDATGAERFTHITAVAKLVGSRATWEDHQPFRTALDGNPATIITFREMVTEIQGKLTTTLASTEVGRMLQMFLAADMKVKPD